jgi:hypothetical protein
MTSTDLLSSHSGTPDSDPQCRREAKIRAPFVNFVPFVAPETGFGTADGTLIGHSWSRPKPARTKLTKSTESLIPPSSPCPPRPPREPSMGWHTGFSAALAGELPFQLLKIRDGHLADQIEFVAGMHEPLALLPDEESDGQ